MENKNIKEIVGKTTDNIKKIFMDKGKRRTAIIIAAAVLIALIVVISFISCSRTRKDNTIAGVIKIGEDSSETLTNLFLVTDTGYLINLDKLDGRMSLDFMKTDNGYSIRTPKKQMTIKEGERSYKIDQNEIKDASYRPAVSSDSGFFADPIVMFNVFGYTSDFNISANNDLILLTLTKREDTDIYQEVSLAPEEKKEEKETVQTPEMQAAIDRETFLNEGGKPPIIPTPEISDINVPTPEGNIPKAVRDLAGVESSENETEEDLTEKTYVKRTSDYDNDRTDEEFDLLWEEEKNSLASIFKSGVADPGNPAFKQSEDMLVFNPMHGGIYYDTINVIRPEEDKRFIIAEFSSDWSDQEGNTDNADSKAYYRGLPSTYERTIKQLIGPEIGQELYSFIKEHADITPNGGYVAGKDENGNPASVYTDGPVGDGCMCSELDFSQWQGRQTDYGLRFSVSRAGDGFRITIYKK